MCCRVTYEDINLEAAVEALEGTAEILTSQMITGATTAGESEEMQERAKAKPELEEGPDALTLYLQEIGSIPPLTQERESELIKQMKEGQEKLEDEVLSSPAALRYVLALRDRLTAAEPEEFQQIAEGEGEIRRQEFLRNASLVRQLAASRDQIVTELKPTTRVSLFHLCVVVDSPVYQAGCLRNVTAHSDSGHR